MCYNDVAKQVEYFLNGVFLFYRRFYTFFRRTQSFFEFGKNADSVRLGFGYFFSFNFNLFGDSRSLAFFGAAASVVALFNLQKEKER